MTDFVDFVELERLALRVFGYPYLFGAKPDFNENDPKAFDCSGFIRWVYAGIGIVLPEGSQEQYEVSKAIKVPQTGDVGFFLKDGVSHHVGMIISKTDVIEVRGFEPTLEAQGIKTNCVLIRPRERWEAWHEFSGWRRLLAVM